MTTATTISCPLCTVEYVNEPFQCESCGYRFDGHHNLEEQNINHIELMIGALTDIKHGLEAYTPGEPLHNTDRNVLQAVEITRCVTNAIKDGIPNDRCEIEITFNGTHISNIKFTPTSADTTNWMQQTRHTDRLELNIPSDVQTPIEGKWGSTETPDHEVVEVLIEAINAELDRAKNTLEEANNSD